MAGAARQAIASAVTLSLCLPFTASGALAQAPIQSLSNNPESRHILADSASPFGEHSLGVEEIAKIEMPKLYGPVTAADEANFDKYYYFHRAGTDVSTAYGDISECDGYARGLATSIQYTQAPYPYTYTMAGAIGGAIGNAMVAAIFGSAEKRRMRRVNMRACMGFKGYQRYGLPKDLWEKFNFEEGLDGVTEEVRRHHLQQQALVAARATPAERSLEP